ncbi:MAG: anti-sigma factor domain-containing protein [Sedimentibacter sp.]
MKAIIVEVKGKYAAVLTDDGIVSKIKNRNYEIGQEIVIKNNSNRLIRMSVAAAAAIMIFATPAWAYLAPYSYVSIDVNPSFEFLINRFDRVLTVKGFNDDGRELSKDINIDGLKNKEIQSAVKSVLNELKSKGYIIEGEEDSVIIATSSKSEAKKDTLSEKIRTVVNEKAAPEQTEDTEVETIQTKESKKSENTGKLEVREESATQQKEEIEEPEEPTDDNNLKNSEKQERQEKQEKQDNSEEQKKPERWEKPEEQKKPEKREKTEKANKSDRKKNDIEVIEVTKREVDEAKKKGVTPGKLNLIEKLQESAKLAGHKIKTDEWLDKSVQEINAKVKEYKEELKQKEIENKNNNKKDTSDKWNKNDNKNKKNELDKWDKNENNNNSRNSNDWRVK